MKMTLGCLGIVLIGNLFAACPSPIDPLPTLPIPYAPASGSCPGIPTPTTLTGYLPITIVNNSNLAASDIYICVLVNSSSQYLSFTNSGGHLLASISNFTPSTYISTSPYSHPLSFFEHSGSNYTFYIPNDGNTAIANSNVMQSSRILVSLYEPLTYFIDYTGLLGVPASVDATSDNYYILNDKIEYDLGSNGHNRLNLNLTWVDFFSIPFNVQASYKLLNGVSYIPSCAVTGMPTSLTQSGIISSFRTACNNLLSPFDTYWRQLIATYTNPDGSGNSDLRIFAPATAMGSAQTQTNPTTITFPTNYFLSSSISPDTCSWFDAVWYGQTATEPQAYYQNQKPVPYLILDATTKHGTATATGHQLEGGDFWFQIAGGPDKGSTITFPKPNSSKAFFTGASSDYSPAITSSASQDTLDQVLKVFATSIISGFFPINCQTATPFTITNSYVQSHVSEYFANNAILNNYLSACSCVANIPWYDFYSRTLLTIGTPNVFYTSAYSDFLGADGTIVITSLADNNADATITVNIADCTGVVQPNPYSDTNNYNVTIALPGTGVTAAYSLVGPTSWHPITSNPFNIPITPGNSFYLQITYTAGSYNGLTAITQIAPAAQLFHPILPGQGNITTSGSNCTVAIGASPNS